MKKLILVLLAILLMFIAAPGAYADEDQGLKINDHTKFELKFDQDTQQFDIRGEITAAAGNNFVVSGQTIFIDPSQIKEFEQKGIIAVGKRINVIGTGAGRFKFETENQPLSVGTTSSSNIQIKVKANGPIQQVETFLEQILALLKSFIS